VLVIGMHRSGTSAVARGLAALSVYLGDNFLDAQPENPTGYWEDKAIVELNDRVLATLGLKWDDLAPIERKQLERFRVRRLRGKAVRYVKRTFGRHALWGFKDPRTIRLLPFWRRALRDCDSEDAYIVVIRNPLSVAASLFRRQAMDIETAQRLWLVHMLPFLDEIRDRPFVVVDYDLLMAQPRPQLERIAEALHLPSPDAAHSDDVERFAAGFLDEGLRHTVFSPRDLDASTAEARLTQQAYLLLYDAASDRLGSEFWPAWERIRREYETQVR
jgi:O-antigen biosynthesis protein